MRDGEALAGGIRAAADEWRRCVEAMCGGDVWLADTHHVWLADTHQGSEKSLPIASERA
jgi:hypothetical protein